MQSYKDSMRRQYEEEQAKKPSFFSGKFSQAALGAEDAAIEQEMEGEDFAFTFGKVVSKQTKQEKEHDRQQ